MIIIITITKSIIKYKYIYVFKISNKLLDKYLGIIDELH